MAVVIISLSLSPILPTTTSIKYFVFALAGPYSIWNEYLWLGLITEGK